jgi:hypothetical protein
MPDYQCEILSDNKENKELKAYLDDAPNSTIFHRPEFLSYHDTDKFKSYSEFSFCHAIFRDEKNKITAFIPGATYLNESGIKIYKTPFFSSYGGLVYGNELKFTDIEKILDLFTDTLLRENVREIKFTQTADCYSGEDKRNNYISFILKSRGFDLSDIEMILIKPAEADFEKSFHNTIQRQVRQAFKNDLEFKAGYGGDRDSYDLLAKSQERLGGRPTHTFEELELISRKFPESVVRFGTFHKDKLIAGITGFICNRNVLNTFYIYDNEYSRDLKGMQFTYYNVLKWANETGLSYIDFGPSTFGLKPHYSLISYKEKYGSIPMLRQTFIKEL